MKTVYVFFLFLATATITFAQAPDTLWTRTFGGTGIDECIDAIQTFDDGYALAGYTGSFGMGHADGWLVRTNSSGDSLWSRTFGGSYGDVFTAILCTSDSGFALTGYTLSFGAGGADYWLVKTDAQGNIQWSRTFGGSEWDVAMALVQTTDGGFALAGYSHSYGAGETDFWLVKTDSQGNTQWNRTFGGAGFDQCRSMHQTPDGGYILGGYTTNANSETDFWLVKTDQAGNLSWSHCYGGSNEDACTSVIQTRDGGYAMAGVTTSFGSGWGDYWLVKADSIGDSLWSRTYGGTGYEHCFNLIEKWDGDYLLGGITQSADVNTEDMWLVSVDAQGNLLWNRHYGGSARDECASLLQTSDGGYIVVGFTTSIGQGMDDFYVVKLALDQVLPVELSSFEALSLSSGIRLSFSTASETDNAFFEILRGNSETGEFNRITTLPSQGNSATGHQYEYLDREVTAGQTYWYYLTDVDLSGTRTEHREMMRSAAMTGAAELPSDYSLSCYPNPFNPSTTISFALPDAGFVRVNVYDVSGRWVRTLADERREAGSYDVAFNASGLPSGVYFVRMESGRFAMTKKMLLVR